MTERPLLLERAAETSRLRSLRRAAAAGRGGALVLEGLAGMGKTALLQEEQRLARRAGFEVLCASGSELEHGFAFGVVRQLIEPQLAADAAAQQGLAQHGLLSGAAAHAAPIFAPQQPPSPARPDEHAVMHGLYWAIAAIARVRPVLACVDDAHWADEPSLRFLAYLARRLTGLPVGVLIAARPTVGTGTLLAHAERIGVPPLTEDAAGTLLARRLGARPEPGFLAACVRATGGVPFHLHALGDELARRRVAPVEAAAGLVESIGSGVVARSLVQRIGALGPQALGLAEAVSVLGNRRRPNVLARVAGIPARRVAELSSALVRSGVFADSTSAGFAHPILLASVRERVPEDRRQRMHAAAAELLLQAGAGTDEVAAHVELAPAGSVRGGIAILTAAAEEAGARSAPLMAARWLNRLLEERLDGPARQRALLALGTAELLAGAPWAERSLSLAAAAGGDGAVRAAALRALAGLWCSSGRAPEAVRMLQDQLQEALPAPDRAELERAVVEIADLDPSARPAAAGVLAGVLDRTGGGFWAAHRAVEASLVGSSARQAAAFACRAFDDGQFAESEGLFGQLTAYTLTLADAYDEAGRYFEVLMEGARRRGSAMHYAAALTHRGLLASRTGPLVEAEADTREALVLVGAHEWTSLEQMALAVHVEVLLLRGEVGRAAEELAGIALAPIPQTIQDAVLRCARGNVNLAAADPHAALEDLLLAGKSLVTWGLTNPSAFAWRSQAALAYAALGEVAAGRELAAEEVALARRWGAARALGTALRAEGLVLGGEDGLRALAEAVQVLDGTASRPALALALTDLGALLRRRNARTAARGYLQRGWEVAHDCGADRLAERAYTELWATGARPRRPRRTGLDALTPSERRVAALAASGRSNVEVAQHLFVTEKTVETHLSAAYRKLGIDSRRQLAVALRNPRT